MSVNIGVWMEISGLRDDREQVGLTALLTDVLRAEGLEREVVVTLVGTVPDLRVRADSGSHKVIFSRFHAWRPTFEEKLTAEVQQLVPHARVDFDWEYDDDH